MFKDIDHVVIAVKDLDASIKQYEAIYGVPATERHATEGAGFENVYFRLADSYVELVCPTDEAGPVGRRVATSGEGVYMIAARVDDINATLSDLRAKGIRLVGDPGEGNPVKGMVFVHPSMTGGVLTQIVQRS